MRGPNSNANKLRFHNYNARVLGQDHRATKALARAAVTMAPADLWKARLAVKTLLRKRLHELTTALGVAASRSD